MVSLDRRGSFHHPQNHLSFRLFRHPTGRGCCLLFFGVLFACCHLGMAFQSSSKPFVALHRSLVSSPVRLRTRHHEAAAAWRLMTAGSSPRYHQRKNPLWRAHSTTTSLSNRRMNTELYSESSSSSSSTRAFSSTHLPSTNQQRARVYVAVGSNLGNRFENINAAIKLLTDSSFNNNDNSDTNNVVVKLVHTSMLHETAPMYVTDQPSFLNGVIEIETNLTPIHLLRRIKQVEAQLGRDLEGGIRNGPRPVDLDILFYLHQDQDQDDNAANSKSNEKDHVVSSFQSLIMETPDLVIPHPRIAEREFVLAPLCEVASLSKYDNNGQELQHPILGKSVYQLFQELLQQQDNNEPSAADEQRAVILPLPCNRMLSFNETVIMGILNVTPDSFSDGGKWNESIQVAVQRALEMEQEGAGIIDIGGESTRPGAAEVDIDKELERTIPVIQQLRRVSDIPIAIDTRHAVVAKAAVEAGADMVNDVSGGLFDPKMLPTVADLGVPIVLMHMRGTPETMQAYATDYQDIVQEVSQALRERCKAAEEAGIPRWRQIVDPGIGFAKDRQGNLSLLKHLHVLRASMGMHSTPILLGTSRKGFIGKLTGIANAEDRDYGTVASCVAALCLGGSGKSSSIQNDCNIVRVHNVKAMKEAAVVMDGIRRAS